MTVLSLVERRVFDHIGNDEFGIEYGRTAHGRQQTTYQPIFSVGRRGQLKLSGLRAGLRGGPAEPEFDTASMVAAPLALRNFGHSGTAELDLYLDQALVGSWTAHDLASCAAHGRANIEVLPEPRRVFLELSPNGRAMPLPAGGPFRVALVNERPEDELDAWIARFRPAIVRLEGKWVASLAQHEATRTLLSALAGTLSRRGVKTLFEGLDTDSLVSFAIECGADFAQGNALAAAVVAGQWIDPQTEHQSAKIISVDFGRGRKPTVA